jgi:hypothetical protein
MPAYERDGNDVYEPFNQITYGNVLTGIYKLHVVASTIRSHSKVTAIKANAPLDGLDLPLTAVLTIQSGRKVALDVYNGKHDEFEEGFYGWENPKAELFAAAVAGRFDPVGRSVGEGDYNMQWKDQAYPIDPLGPREIRFPVSTAQELVYLYYDMQVKQGLISYDRRLAVTPFFAARSEFFDKYIEPRQLRPKV